VGTEVVVFLVNVTGAGAHFCYVGYIFLAHPRCPQIFCNTHINRSRTERRLHKTLLSVVCAHYNDGQARNVDANSEGFEMTADGKCHSLTWISKLNATTFSKLQRALP
jgi:hypothetical protein